MTRDEFAASYWEVAPLLRSAAQLSVAGFGDLLSLDGVDELISRRGLRTPFVRMSRNGDLLAASRFTRAGGAGAEISDQVADDKVLAEFAAGATLVLQGLHRTWEPLGSFGRELAAQLGHPVQINAYVTPPENAGFAPHYDVHDVFVLQFAGKKRWRVHEPVWPIPLRDHPWQERKAAVAERASGQPLLDRVLENGDALYLPRGYIHSATSLNEVSGHLTIGVHPVTRSSLADEIFSALGDDLDMRRALPLGFDAADERTLATDLDVTIAALHAALDRCDRAAVARGIARRLESATRPAPLGPLAQLATAGTLDADRAVHVRPGLRFTTRIEDQSFVIEAAGRSVRFARAHADAVRVATAGPPVTARDLPCSDTADGVALLGRLLRDGIVVPA